MVRGKGRPKEAKNKKSKNYRTTGIIFIFKKLSLTVVV
jgi:hypothetical protein